MGLRDIKRLLGFKHGKSRGHPGVRECFRAGRELVDIINPIPFNMQPSECVSVCVCAMCESVHGEWIHASVSD